MELKLLMDLYQCMRSESINVAFTFNYYEFNTSDTKSKTFKACFKRFDLKNTNSIIKSELL